MTHERRRRMRDGWEWKNAKIFRISYINENLVLAHIFYTKNDAMKNCLVKATLNNNNFIIFYALHNIHNDAVCTLCDM